VGGFFDSAAALVRGGALSSHRPAFHFRGPLMTLHEEYRLRRFVREAYKHGWAGSRQEAKAAVDKVARDVTAKEVISWVLREMPHLLSPSDFSSVHDVVHDEIAAEISARAGAAI
jgi:hypothetical protein